MPLWSLSCVWQQHYQRGRGSVLRAGSSSHLLIASPHVSGWGYWSSAKPRSGAPCRVQVSAHGTGASIPPVDEMVVSMKLITPAEGTITVSRDRCPDLFNMTRVGLGALGIVSEVTLQLVPAHHLLEHTFIMSSKVRTFIMSCWTTPSTCPPRCAPSSCPAGLHLQHVLQGAHLHHVLLEHTFNMSSEVRTFIMSSKVRTFIMSSKVRTRRPCSTRAARPLCWRQALWQTSPCS